MATRLQIINKGLASLGAKQITSLTEGSPQSKLALLYYEDSREALQRLRPWKFCTKLVQLTENATAPIFGKDRAFDLPADYLAPLAPYPEQNLEALDWVIEGANPKQLRTNMSSPLDFRYTAHIKDESAFDILFSTALSALLGLELSEQLTQSNTKEAKALKKFEDTLDAASQLNAFEHVPATEYKGSWLNVRFRGTNDNTREYFR